MDFDSLVRDMLDAPSLATFGRSVSYMPRAGERVGETRVVTGIFSAPYHLAEMGEAGVATSVPQVFFRLADLETDPDEDDPIITVGGTEYAMREAQKDGQGGVTLFLRETE